MKKLWPLRFQPKKLSSFLNLYFKKKLKNFFNVFAFLSYTSKKIFFKVFAFSLHILKKLKYSRFSLSTNIPEKIKVSKKVIIFSRFVLSNYMPEKIKDSEKGDNFLIFYFEKINFFKVLAFAYLYLKKSKNDSLYAYFLLFYTFKIFKNLSIETNIFNSSRRLIKRFNIFL